MADEKRPVGRPTIYNEEIGHRIMEGMSRGLSLTAAAAMCDIHRQRVYDWERDIPEFAELVRIARAKRQYWLENELTTTTAAPRITAMIFALKNAAPADWLEKTHTEVTGKDGGPIESKQSLDITGLSDAVLEELLSKLGQK